jgi:hypothetical protein
VERAQAEHALVRVAGNEELNGVRTGLQFKCAEIVDDIVRKPFVIFRVAGLRTEDPTVGFDSETVGWPKASDDFLVFAVPTGHIVAAFFTVTEVKALADSLSVEAVKFVVLLRREAAVGADVARIFNIGHHDGVPQRGFRAAECQLNSLRVQAGVGQRRFGLSSSM